MRAFVILSVASAFLGLAAGLYETILPVFLSWLGLDFRSMAFIYAAAGLSFLARPLVGAASDRLRRKFFYGGAVWVSAAAFFLTPLVPAGFQVVPKLFSDAAMRVRQALHAVLSYETAARSFRLFQGRTRGFEWLAAAGGALVVTLLALSGAKYSTFFAVGGACAGIAGLVFFLGFPEPERKERPGRFTLRELFRVPRGLRFLALIVFLFNAAVSTSHCHVMPLFFRDRFGMSVAAVGVILAGHRATIGLPMLFSGKLFRENLRAAYAGFMCLEGLLMAGSGLVPRELPALAVGVWLMHDLVGAGLWGPIQDYYIQRLAPARGRAAESGKVLSIGGLGFIAGPLIAGLVAPTGELIHRAFIVSGAMIALVSVLVIFLPRLEEPAQME